MKDSLYEKKVNCPSCKSIFTTQKVRTRRLKVLERQPDFYVKYEGVDPLYYQVWICPNCGFSATESEYTDLRRDERDLLYEKISKKWMQRDFGNVRTFEEAEESFKLALITAQLLKKSRGYIGSIFLKLGWLNRGKSEEKENEYLKSALDILEEAYQEEYFPIAGLNEVALSYLIGELHRRFGNTKEAIHWYAKALDHPEIKNNRQIQIRARDQWSLAREERNQ